MPRQATAEVNPDAQYDPASSASGCGTYDNPCSTPGVVDAAEPAAEDAQYADQALGEAHDNNDDVGLLDASLLEEAQAAEPPTGPPSAEHVASVLRYAVPASSPVADGYYPAGLAPAPEQATPVSPEARVEEAEPVRRSKPASTGMRGARATAKMEIPTAEADLILEDAVEEARPRPTGEGSVNRLSTVPFSATGGTLILALGVGALLHRRFGR
jgi:hypothetical protein